MDFGKSFTYIFEDQDWIKKILLAAVITFIPIVGPLAVAGWGVEITKRVIQNDPEQLPDWNNFIDYLVKGLVLILIGFVYMLPVIVVQVCANSLLVLAQGSGEDTMTMIGSTVIICLSCLTIIYAILVAFLMFAAVGKYADTGELSAAFRFGEIFATVKAAPMAYVMALLGSFLAGLIAMAGVIACIIGVFFTAAIAGAINAHLQGQAYREAKQILEGQGSSF